MRFDHAPGDVGAALRRLIDDINRFIPAAHELAVFADDASAAAGQVRVGEEYVTPDGFRKRRMA